MKLKKINLDVARLLAAFMIVAIHVYPFEFLNPTLDLIITRVIFRIAVPLFLMITGFYILPKSLNNKKELIHYTIKILKLYGLCILLYLPINLYTHSFQNLTVLTFFKEICFNGTFYHLWYFPSILLGIWITFFIIKKCNWKWSAILVLILYLLGLLGDSYYGLIILTPLKTIYETLFHLFDYTRNGIFYVPVFLWIGYSISKINPTSNPKKNGFLFLFFLMLMTLEGTILNHFGIPKHTSMYLFLLPTSYFLFLTLKNMSQTEQKDFRNISMIIYIWHPIFILILNKLGKIIPNPIFQNSLLFYIIVSLLTYWFAWFYNKIKKTLKMKLK